MNQEYAKKALPLVQAAAEGKNIQARMKNKPGAQWEDAGLHLRSFGFLSYDYRVTPELACVWTVYYKDPRTGVWGSFNTFQTERAAMEVYEGLKKHQHYSKCLLKVVPVSFMED